MNKRKIIISLLFAFIIFNKAGAQVSFSMNVNIGAQPVWGPVGYDHVDYYYLPDIESYYYVPRHQYVYLNAGNWVFANALPPRYASYDVYNSYKVVINEPKPYLNYRKHREMYAPFRGRHDQVIIRNSNEPRYYVVKGHPKYKSNHDEGRGKEKHVENERHDNGHGNNSKEKHGAEHGKGHERGHG